MRAAFFRRPCSAAAVALAGAMLGIEAGENLFLKDGQGHEVTDR
jgi:hypothetical protein